MTSPQSSPLVSIAMCTYNGEKFLRAQLDSLIAQDYRPLEIHVVDDRSSDGTWDILTEYAVRHDFMHIHRNEINQGVVKNFEKALSLCQGAYIGFCDQDDIWLPNKISTHLAEIGDASLTYSQLSYIDENGAPIPSPKRKTNRLSGRCPLALLFHTCVTGHVALFTREVLDHALPFPDGIQAHDHWVPFVAAALNGLHASDQMISLYRAHGNNVSMPKKKKTSHRERIARHKDSYSRKKAHHLGFMRCALTSGLLIREETELVTHLASETEKLDRCIINHRLRKLLRDNGDQFLSIFTDGTKLAYRLSRGRCYYALLLWQRKP